MSETDKVSLPDTVVRTIRRRREQLCSGGSPMSYLHDRVRRDMELRIQESGGWGDRVLYLGFQGTGPTVPHSDCRFVSPLEGDSVSELEQGFDQIVFNLQLAWLNHDLWFRLVSFLLNPGGRFLFSSFGPDTLRELDRAWREVDAMPHVHPFTDMHHLGDGMHRSGFQRPIVDMERMVVEYEDVSLLMADLRREGFHNVLPERRKSLTGRGRLEELRALFKEDSPLDVTFELIYGYAEGPTAGNEGVRVEVPSLQRGN